MFNREIKNYLREKNVSGLLSAIRLAASLPSDDKRKKLSSIGAFLAHFESLPFSRWLCGRALDIASSPDLYTVPTGAINLTSSIIIKPYVSIAEKGFLLVSFEKELEKLVSIDLLTEIEKRYYIIFIPSWTGLFSPPLFALAARSTSIFYVMPVHAAERERCRILGPKCRALPFNAASWVRADLYRDVSVERDIDCLMVANFAEFKRHWILFKALKELPESVRAVCVGVPIGTRTAEKLKKEADYYGVSERVDVVENPAQEELRQYFKRAKLFCALSYREGSFIAVAESLMAGTPVLMFKNAHIGTKELINSKNGALVSSIAELRKGILQFQQGVDYEQISASSERAVSASANCQELNTLLKKSMVESGAEWTQDIYEIFSVRLEFYYNSPRSAHGLRDDFRFFSSLGINFRLPSL